MHSNLTEINTLNIHILDKTVLENLKIFSEIKLIIISILCGVCLFLWNIFAISIFSHEDNEFNSINYFSKYGFVLLIIIGPIVETTILYIIFLLSARFSVYLYILLVVFFAAVGHLPLGARTIGVSVSFMVMAIHLLILRKFMGGIKAWALVSVDHIINNMLVVVVYLFTTCESR